jgi:hypothetical protein
VWSVVNITGIIFKDEIFLAQTVLNFILLMWTLGRATNHASKCEIGFCDAKMAERQDKR